MSDGPPSVRPRDAATWALVGALGMASVMGSIWAFQARSAPKQAEIVPPEPAPASTAAPAPAREGESPAGSEPDAAPAAQPAASDAAHAAPANKAAISAPLPALAPPVPVPLDLNAATQQQLETLPGIGPALAQRIIDDRTARGPFRSVDDLDRVTGIGKKTIDKFRARVTVTP